MIKDYLNLINFLKLVKKNNKNKFLKIKKELIKACIKKMIMIIRNIISEKWYNKNNKSRNNNKRMKSFLKDLNKYQNL